MKKQNATIRGTKMVFHGFLKGYFHFFLPVRFFVNNLQVSCLSICVRLEALIVHYEKHKIILRYTSIEQEKH